MTELTFYRLAALGPVAGQAIATALTLAAGGRARVFVASPDWHYPSSLVRGLGASLLVAAWAWVALPKLDGPARRRLAWLAPLAYVGCSLLIYAVGVAAAGRLRAGDLTPTWMAAARIAVHLAVGYGYVALILFALDRLRDGGRITADPPLRTR